MSKLGSLTSLRTDLPQKLSKKYHPDINPDEAAHERFIEVAKGKPALAYR